jgi:hypothetical protein
MGFREFSVSSDKLTLQVPKIYAATGFRIINLEDLPPPTCSALAIGTWIDGSTWLYVMTDVVKQLVLPYPEYLFEPLEGACSDEWIEITYQRSDGTERAFGPKEIVLPDFFWFYEELCNDQPWA